MYSWQQVAEWLGYLASALVGLKIIWSIGRAGYRKVLAMMGIRALTKDIESLSTAVTSILTELHPNDGSTLRDALTRIENNVALSSEIQHARMLDAPELLFRTDPEGRFLWVNRTYSRTVKRLPAELAGYGWVNAIAEGDRGSVQEKWQTAVLEDRELEMNINFQTPDGEIIPAVMRTYKMTMGRVTLGYVGSVTLI